MLIATLLIVCLMACACGTTPAESAAPSSSEAASTQAPASQAPTSQAPASQAPASQAPASQAPASQAPTSVTPAPNPGAGAVWQDFSALGVAQGKGTEFSAVEGIFTITRGKAQTSSGKTVKEGTKAGTSFTGGVQLGKNGTATDKCITFVMPEGCTSIEVYANCGSSSLTSCGFYVDVNGVPTASTAPYASIAALPFSVAAGSTVTIYSGADGSLNVWGILVQ